MKTIGLLVLLFFFLRNKKVWFSRVAIFFLLFLILDLASKALAQWAVSSQEEWWPWPMVINTGASFGGGEVFLQSLGSEVLVLAGWIVFAAAVSFFLLKHLRSSLSIVSEIATALLLAGIWGNIFDRIFVGGVRDWLPVPAYELFFGLTLYNNLADWFLTVGCILWIYLLFFKIKTS
jgi:lipoprotein signal peptidase